ncbi:Dimerisation domain-containing protein [Flaviramulus basaltis]|uniref:Dimerisation domain-containing protein n=1 Tax=Flaviramulus basaltis TaxID=369401 RepID=A0A1K2INU0_9FLAO|nr:methyltransferase [Flaviramulus basaltis]SFZ93966.1 Dimerisation domain-containing protein [Flaviramulus basaltis]
METAIQPSPAAILQMGTGFWASKVLLTAVNFELFTYLSKKSNQSAKGIKSLLDLKCTDRNTYDFLDCLTGLGFLKREGLLETARYSNTVDTDIFLNKANPSYIGGILEMMNERGWGIWGNLDEGLKTGLIQNEAKNGGQPIFDLLYGNPELLKNFVDGMTGVQMGNFIALSQKFDFSNFKTLVDAGGSAGVLSLMVAKHNPHMNCITFDLPPLESMANETIQKFQMAERVKVMSGDFFKDGLPKADIVTMGNVIHDWDEDTKIKLIQIAYDALPKGGVLIAIENVIDNERKQNVFGMMMSLNMLIETGDGFDYTFDDFNRWAKKVGFSSTELLPLTGPSSAAIAIK